MKNEKHDNLSGYKVQHSSLIKILNSLVTEGKFFNMIKAIYVKLTANIIITGNNSH